ncbi:helix-turn-helix domain-containing protein [Methylocucumis oryzae]|uniref:helix-turn-helix domain-containing protein n=1 Tax=Methylocucumis oryzae TaxID=1632867 RepID=UPI0012FF0E36
MSTNAVTWLNAWDNSGVAALLDKPRSGRPRKLSGESKDYTLDKVAESPRSLKTVLAHDFLIKKIYRQEAYY